MSVVNLHGMYLFPDAYSIYRVILAISAAALQTALIVYGPDVE